MHPTASRLARNVYEILSKLPRHGVGSKLSRKTWQDNSFWVITDVKLETSGKGGKAYGLLTWRGEQQNSEPRSLNGSYKKVWRPIGAPQPRQAAWPSLALEALKAEGATSEAAPAAKGEAAEEGVDRENAP